MFRDLFILGAPDAEMALIETLLRDAGQAFTHAASVRGDRVRPGELPDPGRQTLPDEGTGQVVTLYLVEVAARPEDAGLREQLRRVFGAQRVVVIDHHDTPEASYPPARYWGAASCGQVWRLLHGDAPPPMAVRLEAAADHCLGAAFAGQCPGVEREALWTHCVQTRAAAYGATPELLEVARATLQSAAAHPAFAGLDVADLTADPAERGSSWSDPDAAGVCYPCDFMGGPLVGAAQGRAYLVRVKTRDGCALRGGGGGDACAAAGRWPELAEGLGCYGADAPRPQNAYSYAARGNWGGTLRWVSQQGALQRDALQLAGVNLRHAKLVGADLRGADLRGALLGAAFLRGAQLEGADLRGAQLQNAALSGADLRGADLRGAALQGADLRGAMLEGATLRGAVLLHAQLRRADLRGAVLVGANLTGAVLACAHLEGADLRDAILDCAGLQCAHLEGAHLRGAYLGRADLCGADLRRAALQGADLRGAMLEGANLEGANLEGADLRGAQLEGAHMEGATLDGAPTAR